MMNYLRSLGSHFMEHSNFFANLNSKADACGQRAIGFHLFEHVENKNKSRKRGFWLACEHRRIIQIYMYESYDCAN